MTEPVDYQEDFCANCDEGIYWSAEFNAWQHWELVGCQEPEPTN